MKIDPSTLYRLVTSQPLAGRDEAHTLKEWKRVYGYERDTIKYLGGRFVEAHPATLAENVLPAVVDAYSVGAKVAGSTFAPAP